MFAYCNNNPVNFSDPSGEFTIAITTLILIVSIVAGVCVSSHVAYTSYKYTGEVDWNATLLSGLSTFTFCYSFGTYAYGMYVDYCNYKGYTPATHIGSTPQSNTVPQTAKDTLEYIDNNGRAPQGYKGGKVFLNDGRNGGIILPKTGEPYHEYDIHPYIKGTSRGLERLVVGSDNSVWYTKDHYKTFFNMR